jgi:hypothetical protein
VEILAAGKPKEHLREISGWESQFNYIDLAGRSKLYGR